MSKKKMFQQGKQIMDLEELNFCMKIDDYVWFDTRPFHRKVLEQMRFCTIVKYIRDGLLFSAVKNNG